MKRLEWIALMMVGSSLVFCSTTQGGQGVDDTTARVRERLSQGYEQAPTVAEISALGPGVDRSLFEIYNDPSSTMLLKMRALDQLAAYPSDDLRSLLEHESARSDLSPALARRVLAAAVQAYGEREPAVAERVWQKNAASADATVRFHAAETLAKLHPSKELVAAARVRATAEPDSSVREELDRSIAAVESR